MTRRQIMLVFFGTALGMVLAALDQTIVATALPAIVAELHGFNHLSWVVTAYLLTSTITVPLYGKFSDVFGRKRVFIFAIVLFLIGSALSGLSRSMIQLIVFRGIQGLGAGGVIPLAQAIIGEIFSPEFGLGNSRHTHQFLRARGAANRYHQASADLELHF